MADASGFNGAPLPVRNFENAFFLSPKYTIVFYLILSQSITSFPFQWIKRPKMTYPNDMNGNASEHMRQARRKLALPFYLVLLVGGAMIAGLLVLATHGQNQVAKENSIHLFRSVLKEKEHSFVRTILDYSYWDQAVDHLVTKFDPLWAKDNIGDYVYETFGISSSYVLDGVNRRVFSSIDGKPTPDDPLARFSGGIGALILRARAGSQPAKPPTPAAGFLRDGDVVHLAVANVLTTYSYVGEREISEATDSVMIFTIRLDEDLLAEISNNYLLKELHFHSKLSEPSETSDGHSLLPLTAVDGSALGALAWRPDSPGAEMLWWLLPAIIAMLTLIAGITYLFLGRTQDIAQAFFDEITERQQIELELTQARKMDSLGTLVGGIAHNFNNMLQPIIALNALTMAKLPKGSKEHKNLEISLKACERATDLVARVMSFSRIHKPDSKPAPFNKVIEECLLLLRSTVPSSVKITEHLETIPNVISVDAGQIQTVLINLVSNAVDVMENKNGEIKIALSKIQVNETREHTVPGLGAGNYARLTIADDGPGMDNDTLHQVFDPFFTTKPVNKGTGLGLYTVHGIITGYGGAIRASSKLGQGAAFDIYLPLTEERAA